MKNGDYKLVVALDYPGKKFRGRYVLEHHYVWWKEKGFAPLKGQVIHHINGDKFDNSIENLELLSAVDHCKLHNKAKESNTSCRICHKAFHVAPYRLKRNCYCSRECQHNGLRIYSREA
jgi:hypothetical protein